MSEFHLAQINIARLIAPVDDPRIADFVAQLDTINALAERSEGFVWRLKSESGNATDVAYSDDPLIVVNMSVWESVEALKTFTYRSGHVSPLKDRARWFERPSQAHYCLWWIPAGHTPTVAEGRTRLDHYRAHGDSEYAFWFAARGKSEIAPQGCPV
jgi:hypothetical protein